VAKGGFNNLVNNWIIGYTCELVQFAFK